MYTIYKLHDLWLFSLIVLRKKYSRLNPNCDSFSINMMDKVHVYMYRRWRKEITCLTIRDPSFRLGFDVFVMIQKCFLELNRYVSILAPLLSKMILWFHIDQHPLIMSLLKHTMFFPFFASLSISVSHPIPRFHPKNLTECTWENECTS